MTIYSSTTLSELLDALDMRIPELATPIRECVEELENDLETARANEAPETCAGCAELEDEVSALEAELADSHEQCAALRAAGGAS